MSNDVQIAEDLKEHYEICGKYQRAHLLLCRQLIERTSRAESALAAMREKRKPIWSACVDEVPSLTTTPHEICDPGELTSEEIVSMWDALKKDRESLKKQLDAANLGWA